MSIEFSPKLLYTGEELKSKIKEAAETVISEYDTNAGWIVSVVHNEETIFSKAYGYADIENKILNTDTNTCYSIASTGKQLCAGAFLQNWELQGRSFEELKTRDLNDIIAELEELSPEFSIKFRLDDNGYNEPVTIWNLLTHTAGLEDSYVNMFADIGEDLSKFKTHPTLYNRLHLINNSCSKRVYPPNTVHSYSNSGYVIVGYLLELLTRKSFPNALGDTIFKPLGMTGSTASPRYENDSIYKRSLLPDSDPAKLVIAKPHNHIKKKDGTTQVKPLPDKENCHTIVYAPGSSVVTCADMNKWMIMLLNRGYYQGKQILLPNTIGFMMDKQFVPFGLSASGTNCGLGTRTNVEFGVLHSLGHGGGLPGFLTDEKLIPEFKMGIFVSTNAGISKGMQEVAKSIMKSIFLTFTAEQQEIMIDKPTVVESSYSLKQFAGYYSTTRAMESHYLSMVMKVFGPETKVAVGRDGKHLVDGKGNKMYPVKQPSDEQNISFLYEEAPKKQEKEKDPVEPSRKYAGFTIKKLPHNQTDVYLNSPDGTFRKRKWHQRGLLHQSIFGFVVGTSFGQLLYGGIRYAFAQKLPSWPKTSLLATGVAACIFSFPAILGVHVSTSSFTQTIARRLPLWTKSAFSLSQIGMIVLGCKTATKLIKFGGVQDSIAVLNTALFTGFLFYWNLNFWTNA
ncbi:hypothetical protein HDV06_007179 [Boothiomyces sp. JEL0866]|nr:hypothetical protein HDV06_007179 [Boothiomyces sp. JEL0866]